MFASENPHTLTEILRDEWGFDGYIVSDCGAVCDFHTHHRVTEDAAESAALAVNNGCIMNCGAEYAYLIAAIARGLVSEETITKDGGKDCLKQGIDWECLMMTVSTTTFRLMS